MHSCMRAIAILHWLTLLYYHRLYDTAARKVEGLLTVPDVVLVKVK